MRVIIIVSVVLRVASALYMGNVVEVLPGISDQVTYDALARRVLDGRGFTFATGWWPATRAGEPTALWSFLYTLYVAGTHLFFGPSPLATRLIQAVAVGVLFPWLGWRLGSRMFGPAAGLASAAVLAFYPYFIYYSGALMTEPFYIAAILWSLDLATGRMSSSRSLGSWALLGLALGTAVLLRQLFSLIIPFLLLWLVWPGGGRSGVSAWAGSLRRHAAGLLVAFAVVVFMVAPWTARNYAAFGRLVPLNTNAGYAFFFGNHPVYGTTFQPILKDGSYYDLIPRELRGLDEAALDQELLRRGLGFVIDDPIRYLRLSASRIPEYFTFWPSAESGLPGNVARVGSFLLLAPAALLGLWLSVTKRRVSIRVGEARSVLLVGLFALVYTTIHVLSWTLIRYRLPVDASLAVFAGLGYATVARAIVRRPAATLQPE